MAPPVHVSPACWPDDLSVARGLLQRYFEALAADACVPASIRNKDRRPEMEGIAALYDPATAPLLLVWAADRLQGCVAVRMLPGRSSTAELKRLYVVPESRGAGVGKLLVHAAIAWARHHGATELLLDTLPAAMAPALRLYGALGFQPTDCYNQNTGEEFAFFRLQL